ncbi:hypothetical protein BFS13_10245 [Pantoea sp. Ae16]|nr:hypothetical protein BFS13_10245 [Pantoea sp. Ae16]
MTHRLNRPEAREFFSRHANARDAPGMLVELTPRGLEVIDRAVEKHVENARQILSGLSDTLQRN